MTSAILILGGIRHGIRSGNFIKLKRGTKGIAAVIQTTPAVSNAPIFTIPPGYLEKLTVQLNTEEFLSPIRMNWNKFDPKKVDYLDMAYGTQEKMVPLLVETVKSNYNSFHPHI